MTRLIRQAPNRERLPSLPSSHPSTPSSHLRSSELSCTTMSTSLPAAAAAAGDARRNLKATPPAAAGNGVVLDDNEDFAVLDVVNVHHHVPDFTITHHLVQGAPASATVSPAPQAVDAGVQTISPTAPPSSSAALSAQSDAFAAGPPGLGLIKDTLDATAEVFKNMLYRRCLGPEYARDNVDMNDTWVPVLEAAVESASSSVGNAPTTTKAKMPSSSSSAGLADATTKTKIPSSASSAGLAAAATPTKAGALPGILASSGSTSKNKMSPGVTFADSPTKSSSSPGSKPAQTFSLDERAKLRQRQQEAVERVQRQQQ